MAVVYRHRRLDTFEVFYVGIGKVKNRAYETKTRNNWWKKVVNKTSYQVEIIQENLSWEEACELEIFLISQYGRRDLGIGNLVNLTDGGDGQSNPSIECRLKMKGNKMNVRGEDHHLYGIAKTKEHREKLRNIKLNKKLSDEHRNRMKETAKVSKYKKAIKVICKSSGKIWNSIKDCENDLGVKNLRDYLNPNRTNLKNKYNIEYLDVFSKTNIDLIN